MFLVEFCLHFDSLHGVHLNAGCVLQDFRDSACLRTFTPLNIFFAHWPKVLSLAIISRRSLLKCCMWGVLFYTSGPCLGGSSVGMVAAVLPQNPSSRLWDSEPLWAEGSSLDHYPGSPLSLSLPAEACCIRRAFTVESDNVLFPWEKYTYFHQMCWKVQSFSSLFCPRELSLPENSRCLS